MEQCLPNSEGKLFPALNSISSQTPGENNEFSDGQGLKSFAPMYSFPRSSWWIDSTKIRKKTKKEDIKDNGSNPRGVNPRADGDRDHREAV